MIATFPWGEEDMQSDHICRLPILDSVDAQKRKESYNEIERARQREPERPHLVRYPLCVPRRSGSTTQLGINLENMSSFTVRKITKFPKGDMIYPLWAGGQSGRRSKSSSLGCNVPNIAWQSKKLSHFSLSQPSEIRVLQLCD